MTSEYLKRCRVLANKKATNTIHTSAGYIKLLDYAERLEIELNKTNDKIKKMLSLIEQHIAEHNE